MNNFILGEEVNLKMEQVKQQKIVFVKIQSIENSRNKEKKNILEAIEAAKYNNRYHETKMTFKQAKQANWAKYGDFYLNNNGI